MGKTIRRIPFPLRKIRMFASDLFPWNSLLIMTISLIKNAQVKNHLPSWLDRLWNDICWICSKQKIRQNGGFLTFCEKPIGGKNILRKGCTIESMQKQIWNHDTLKKPVKHVLLPWIIQEKIKVTVLLLQISPTPQDESLFSEWQFFCGTHCKWGLNSSSCMCLVFLLDWLRIGWMLGAASNSNSKHYDLVFQRPNWKIWSFLCMKLTHGRARKGINFHLLRVRNFIM